MAIVEGGAPGIHPERRQQQCAWAASDHVETADVAGVCVSCGDGGHGALGAAVCPDHSQCVEAAQDD